MGDIEKHYTCDVSGLPIVELKQFINLDFGNGYKVNLRKIGDSIIHSFNEGNMKHADIKRYNAEIERFIVEAKVQKPYIEIRDLSNLTGRAPSREFQTQVKYLKDHESDIAGFFVCGTNGMVELIIKSAFRLLKSNVKIGIFKDYSKTIQRATAIINHKSITQENLVDIGDLETHSDWCIKNDHSEVKYEFIKGKLLLTTLNGKFIDEDIQPIGNLLERILQSGEFEGKEYIRIADYSKLHHTSFRVRNLYGKVVEKANKKINCTPKITYFCGASSFYKAAMQIYRVTSKQEILFVDSVEKAFQHINQRINIPLDNKKDITVSHTDIDEIIHLGGSLIWGGSQRIDQLVSKSNPLFKVAETLSVVQADLADLREKDVEQNKILSESLDKMKILAGELQKSDEETQQLNEELRATNEQLFEQKEELESAKIQLINMNNNLENLVKERTEKLKDTVEELNKSVSDLDRFVYSASHDLSAPLKSMLGLVNIARKDPDKNQTEIYLDFIENSIQNLEQVIKSLISYSRNNRLELESVEINLNELVNEVINELAFLPDSDKFKFLVEIPPDQFIVSDRQRLKVVLHNLINNGVKYGDYEKPNPYVKIHFEKSLEKYRILIEDNGIGIKDERKDKVFEMFYRGTEKSKGSGLGLFIVNETISALKGDILLESEENIGSKFIIEIPY